MHSILIQTEKTDVPLVLVGGGSCLVDRSVGIHGASSLIIPHKHWVTKDSFCMPTHMYMASVKKCTIYSIIIHVALSPCPLTLLCYTSTGACSRNNIFMVCKCNKITIGIG